MRLSEDDAWERRNLSHNVRLWKESKHRVIHLIDLIKEYSFELEYRYQKEVKQWKKKRKTK
jgi:hypothetical protein